MNFSFLKLTTFLVLTGSLFIISMSLWVGQNIQTMLGYWGESLQMTIYLKETANGTEVEKINQILRSDSRVQNLEFVSNELAVKRFKEKMGSFSKDLEFEKSLLQAVPASFQFAINPQLSPQLQSQAMDKLAGVLKQENAVDEIQYGQDWVKTYLGAFRFVNSTGSVILFLILFSGVLVISNSIRSSLEEKRAEIEILELIGATNHFIRKPFLLEALGLSLVSSLVALSMNFLFFQFLQNHFSQELALARVGQMIVFLKPITMILFLVSSLITGWLAAFLCLRRINSGWAASQKKTGIQI